MTDRIVLSNMRFDGRHGFSEEERQVPQPFEVDVELMLDLAAAGGTDDLDRSVDYRGAYQVVRRVVTTTSVRLLETLAETIARGLLDDDRISRVVVRVRKPLVQLGGPLDFAGVEVVRSRSTEVDRS